MKLAKRGNSGSKFRRQRGGALAIALILLLVMTLLGVQSMRSNIQQERMAANQQDRDLAFQAAEAALRVGEADRPQFTSNKTDLANPVDWADPSGWDSGTGADGQVPGFDAALEGNPHYHVGPPQYVRIGISIPPEWRYIHPVTSIGFGGQPGTAVVIQSFFEPIGQ